MRHITRLFAGLLAACLLSAPTSAESIAQYLPQDTPVHLSLSSGKEIRTALKRVSIARLLQEKEVQLLIDDIMTSVGPSIDQFEKDLGLTYDQLFSLIEGEVTITVTGFSASKNPVADRILMTAEVGDQKATFKKVLAWLKDKLKQTDQRARFGSYSLKQCEVQTIRITDATISTAFYRGRLFASTDSTALAELISKFDEKPAGGLATKPLYKRLKQEVTRGQPGLHLYVDVGGILGSLLRGPGAAKPRELLTTWGVDQIQAVAIGSTISKRGFVERLYVHAPQATRGLFSIVQSLPDADRDIVKLLPEKTFLFQVGALNPLETWLAYLDFVQLVAPEKYKKGYQSLYRFERSIGMKLPQLLKTLGKRFAFYATMPRHEGLTPDIVLLLETQDPQQLRGTLNALIQRLTRAGPDFPAFDIRKIPFDNGHFHYINLSRLGGQQVIAPSFAIRGKWFILAENPINLKAAWMNLDSDKRKSMADSQRFKLISAELSPGWGSLGYLDAGRALVAVYETLGPLFQALIPKGDVPFEPALIPMPQTIAKHLYGIGWATYKTRDGVRIELASPIGAVPLVLAAGIGNTLSQLVRKQRQAYARKTQATPQISFNFKNMPLTQALDQIARTSGVTIMYTRNAVKGVAVSGQVKQVALGQAIARLLPPQLAYRIRETPSGKTQVVVYKAAISGDQKKTQERSR